MLIATYRKATIATLFQVTEYEIAVSLSTKDYGASRRLDISVENLVMMTKNVVSNRVIGLIRML